MLASGHVRSIVQIRNWTAERLSLQDHLAVRSREDLNSVHSRDNLQNHFPPMFIEIS